MNQTTNFLRGHFWLAIVFLTLGFFLSGRTILFSNSIKLAEITNDSAKRDIYKTFDSESENDTGLPIDPFSLMNRLNKMGAMENATPPSDAIDQALNALNESQVEIVPIK